MKDKLIIGAIPFFGHDTSVFYIDAGNKRQFGISTERITRYKHDGLPAIKAIELMVSEMNLELSNYKELVIAVPYLDFETKKIYSKSYNLELEKRKLSKAKYIKEYNNYWKTKSKIRFSIKFIELQNKEISLNQYEKDIAKLLNFEGEVKIKFYDHQTSHAIYSYYYSSYVNALSITLDGYGDGSFSKVFLCQAGKMKELASSKYKKFDNLGWEQKWIGGSVGHIYTAFTILLGFTPLADEGKVEALAAFGNPNNDVYTELMKHVRINKDDDSIFIKDTLKEFMTKQNMERLLERFTKEDLSAAVQKFLEDIMFEYINHLVLKYKVNNLCLSGGVFANVILNKKIFEEITPNIYIVPAMADDGTSVGSLLLSMLEAGYKYEDFQWLKDDVMPYFGPKIEREQVLSDLKLLDTNIKFVNIGDNWHKIAAEKVAEGKIGALFNGNMEWGPRALGNRSIIADTRNKETTEKINSVIKNRPLFQPFCPSILLEEKDRLFAKAYDNFHMTCAFKMKDEFLTEIPSAVHVDGTARVQFVSEKTNKNFYMYLKELKNITGYGVSINTSFNKHGRTIVLSVEDAVVDFLDSEMDFMLIEGILIEKNN